MTSFVEMTRCKSVTVVVTVPFTRHASASIHDETRVSA